MSSHSSSSLDATDSRPPSPTSAWSSGNFTITTSDGVKLQVEDYHLRSAR